LIADEHDTEKLKLLLAELQELTTLELEEIRSEFPQRCPACGVQLSAHTDEMLEDCARKQREE